jgi:hypothetical protein
LTNTNILHKELGLLKVEDIYKLSIIKFVHKCKSNEVRGVFKDYYVSRSRIHTYNTRNINSLEIPSYRTKTYGNTGIKYIGVKLYNDMFKRLCFNKCQDLSIKELSEKFKDHCIAHY